MRSIHQDLQSLSMDGPPPQRSAPTGDVATATSARNKKPETEPGRAQDEFRTLQPEISRSSPQMSTRAKKQQQQKPTSAELEAMDTHPILEPVRSGLTAATAEEPMETIADKTSFQPTKKPGEPFDFVADLMKNSKNPKSSTAIGQGAKIKTSKSADAGLSNGSGTSALKTRSRVNADVNAFDSDFDSDTNKAYALSDSPAY